MMRWGEDGGRTDLAVVTAARGGDLGLALRPYRDGRPTVGLGLFIHEASVIMGVPLLAASAWRRRAEIWLGSAYALCS
jgi:hypothetical protein